MKRKTMSILLLTVAVMLIVLAGCSQPQATLTSISATYSGEDIRVGGTLNKADITVTATYSDESTKNVTDFTVSTLDTATAGDKKVTVTYKDGDITKTCELTITVVADDEQQPAEVTLQSIVAQYKGKNLKVNTQPDKADVVVTATYSDNKTKTVTGFTLSDIDTSTPGEKTVTVRYSEGTKEVTCTFVIRVKSATSIEVTCSVDTVDHNSTLDKNTLTVYVVYDDNSRELLNDTQYSVEADFSQVGERTVTVTYNVEDKQLTDSFTVTVNKVLSGIRAEYQGSVALNEQFDSSKVTVYKVYSDNSEEEITEGYEILADSFSSQEVGQQQITVKLTDTQYECILTVEVYNPEQPATLTGIRAEYTGGTVDVGEQYDASLVKVYKVFNDGNEELITEPSEYTLGELDSATEGIKSVTVTMQDYSTEFQVEVNDVATLYFYNYAQWGEVYAHYWKDGDSETTPTVSTKWPGVTMTKEGDSNWYYIVVDTECQYIIFHNNVKDYTMQTANLVIDYTKPYHAILGWSSEKSVENIVVLDVTQADWTTANARCALYYWNAEGNGWLDLQGVAGQNIENTLHYKYLAVSIEGYQFEDFKFVRMEPNTENSWNATNNLTVSAGLYVTIPSDNWNWGMQRPI